AGKGMVPTGHVKHGVAAVIEQEAVVFRAIPVISHDLTRGVDPGGLAPERGRSLYLLPDGVAAQHPYSVLAEAMQQAGHGALGRVGLSSQRQVVVVRPWGRVLVLDVLHYPAQVRSHAGYAAELACPAASEAERTLARQLLALVSAPLDWARYPDRSAEELAA